MTSKPDAQASWLHSEDQMGRGELVAVMAARAPGKAQYPFSTGMLLEAHGSNWLSMVRASDKARVRTLCVAKPNLAQPPCQCRFPPAQRSSVKVQLKDQAMAKTGSTTRVVQRASATPAFRPRGRSPGS